MEPNETNSFVDQKLLGQVGSGIIVSDLFDKIIRIILTFIFIVVLFVIDYIYVFLENLKKVGKSHNVHFHCPVF